MFLHHKRNLKIWQIIISWTVRLYNLLQIFYLANGINFLKHICISDKLPQNMTALPDSSNCPVMARIREIHFLDVRCFCMADAAATLFRNSRKFPSEDCQPLSWISASEVITDWFNHVFKKNIVLISYNVTMVFEVLNTNISNTMDISK